MGLPSGQAVARRMGVEPIPDEFAQDRQGDRGGRGVERRDHRTSRPEFGHNAPLWFYVLAEAQAAVRDQRDADAARPRGRANRAEVLVGLLLGDRHSFLAQNPEWRPFQEFTRNGRFDMGDLIARALEGKESPQTHTADAASEPALAGGRRTGAGH
jgi:hypothetical protein